MPFRTSTFCGLFSWRLATKWTSWNSPSKNTKPHQKKPISDALWTKLQAIYSWEITGLFVHFLQASRIMPFIISPMNGLGLPALAHLEPSCSYVAVSIIGFILLNHNKPQGKAYSWSSQTQNPGKVTHTQCVIPFCSSAMLANVKCWEYKNGWAKSLTSRS